MEKLPTEIIENILDRLQTEEALRGKQVCTTWRIFLRSKTDKVGLLFAESNNKEARNKLYYGDEYYPIRGEINYHYSSYDKLDKKLDGNFVLGYRFAYYMLGSCNGLVCMDRENTGRPFLICNPITGQVVYIPKPNKSIAQDLRPSRISGFGYCHSTNEYKIVRLHYQRPGMLDVLVYTIGDGDGWRSKGSVHISPWDMAEGVYAGVYANGNLHWLYRKYINKQNKDYAIMAFDLEDEKFEFMDLSDFQNVRYGHSLKLLGGSNLYLVYSTYHNQPYWTDIWAYKRENANTNACVLKGNYNDQNAWHWIKEYSIDQSEGPFCEDLRFIQPLAVTMNNEFILRFGCRFIYFYDLKTLTWHKLVDDGFDVSCNMINVIPHANSTVSIFPLRKLEVQDRL